MSLPCRALQGLAALVSGGSLSQRLPLTLRRCRRDRGTPPTTTTASARGGGATHPGKRTSDDIRPTCAHSPRRLGPRRRIVRLTPAAPLRRSIPADRHRRRRRRRSSTGAAAALDRASRAPTTPCASSARRRPRRPSPTRSPARCASTRSHCGGMGAADLAHQVALIAAFTQLGVPYHRNDEQGRQGLRLLRPHLVRVGSGRRRLRPPAARADPAPPARRRRPRWPATRLLPRTRDAVSRRRRRIVHAPYTRLRDVEVESRPHHRHGCATAPQFDRTRIG